MTGIGLPKTRLIPVADEIRRNEGTPNMDLATMLKEVGLEIVIYTFRNEDQFLAFDYHADAYQEYSDFFSTFASQIDAIFTDFPTTFRNFEKFSYCT